MPSLRAAAAAAVALFAISPALRAAEPVDAGVSVADDDELDSPLVSGPATAAAKNAGASAAISEEIGTIQPDSTAQNPVGATFTNNLTGIINLGDHWSIDLGFLLSLEKGSPPPSGSNFKDSGGHVSLFTLGADWDSGDHWSFGLLTDLSPKSTTNSSTTLNTQMGNNATTTPTDARLGVTSSDLDLQAGASYDTNGESNLEWLFTGNLMGGHLATNQQVTAVYDRATMRDLDAAQLRAYCATHPKPCGKSLNSALQDRDYHLDSLKLDLGGTATIFGSTDIALTGDVYLYAQDPSEVGYFNVATSGRALAGGAGIPIAPLRANGRLDLVHRFGDLSVKVWGSVGEYAVAGDGTTYGSGIKVQYKFTRTFRMWLTGNVQHDVDDTGNNFSTRGLSMGGGFRF